MRPVELFRDPHYDRIVAEQEVRGWAAARDARRAVELFGGRATLERSRPRDLAAERRCAEAFGLSGGELCGCHTPRCDTCASNGGCGSAGCGTCVRLGYQAPVRVAGGGRRLPPGDKHFLPPAAEPLVDVHSHNLCSTLEDVQAALSAGWSDDSGTETDERIDLLYGVKGVEGTSEMWVSGLADKAIDVGKVSDSETVNWVTWRAWARHADFFIPMVQVLQDDLLDSGSGTSVGMWLDVGFPVVGELIIHGHASSNFNLEALTAICREAVERGKPVMVHWDIGRVDAGTDAADNWEDLLELLNSFPRWSVEAYEAWVAAIDAALEAEGAGCGDGLVTAMEEAKAEMRPLRLILAHCGAGPNAVPFDDLDPEFDEYQKRINTLIQDWPNVYFDLAGMQIEAEDGDYSVRQLFDPTESTPSPTPLGAFLLERMEGRPDRFLLGNDIENRTSKDYLWENSSGALEDLFGVESYTSSIQNYLDFLDMGALTADQKEQIRASNARRVRTAYA